MAVHEIAELRDRAHVFRDRAHAGQVLADLLEDWRGSGAGVLAIPAGGVPVADALARALSLPLGAAVVSKITLPWNAEVGIGAVAFDETVHLNDALVSQLELARTLVERGVDETLARVRRRVASLRGAVEPQALRGRPALLVDDGLASGFTMRAAVAALRGLGVGPVSAAVPTGSPRTLPSVASLVEDLYCANVRGGARFAVADAYERWRDVDEGEAAAILADAAESPGEA